jgi:hypothetical protein
MTPEIRIFLWFALGAFMLVRGNTQRNKYERLSQQGQKTTGVVTSVIYDSWLKLYDNLSLYQYSVRFVSADERWISKSYTNLIDSFQSRYQDGESVNIVYNPADPEEFIIDSSPPSLYPLFSILSGTSCVGYSFWLVFQQL